MLDVPGFWVRLTVDEVAKALSVTVEGLRERMQRSPFRGQVERSRAAVDAVEPSLLRLAPLLEHLES